MLACQPAILADVPRAAAFVSLQLRAGARARDALRTLASEPLPDHLVVGLGLPLLTAAGASVPGLRPLPALTGPGVSTPITATALWLRISGDDAGEVLHRTRALRPLLDAFEVVERVDAYLHRDSRDLTGYEDGTENPEGEQAVRAAFVGNGGPGRDGGSFVAVQRWVHDLDAFESMSSEAQNHTFGRDRVSNEELDDAPPSAHVKRTAQEDFSPPAFVLRRSMPWSNASGHGLIFVAFGHSLDAFDALLRRMMGADDGIVDGLFQFTRPVTGASYWCPPVVDGRLDLSALALPDRA